MTGPSSPVAFVLSAGGSLGAIQVGLLRTLRGVLARNERVMAAVDGEPGRC